MSIGRVSTALFFDTGAANIQKNSGAMYELQQQMSSGKRINAPSDDPLAAAQAAVAKDLKAQNEGYLYAVGSARDSINAASTQVSRANDTMQKLYELAVQARNGAYTPQNLQSLGDAAQGLLADLVSVANSTDGAANYLFSGSRVGVKPYLFNGTSYVYQGDQTVGHVRTGATELTQTSWTGVDLFQSALSGDGNVSAQAAATNAGNAFVADARAQTPSSYNGDAYSVGFAMVGSQLNVTITDTTTSTVALGPIPYVEGQGMSFNGVYLEIGGQPAAGDSFTLGKSTRLNALDAVKQFADTLSKAPQQTASKLANTMADSQRAFMAIMDSIGSQQSLMGAELNGLDTREQAINARSDSLEAYRSSLEDVDMAKAITDFQKQKTALQASLESFSSISGLSLFNYLK